MRLRLKFGHRIGLLVALAALALVAVTAVTLWLGSQSEHQLSGIETRYVPLLELDRDLERTYARLVKALEDAADAAEDSLLVEADRLAGELVQRVRTGRAAIVDNGGDPDRLERLFRAYYAVARRVSAALVEGASVASLGDEVVEMRRRQHELVTELETAASPDRRRLAAAFASARDSQRAALRIEIAVALGALALMVLVSWQITRRAVRSLDAVSRGVERLARGEFGTEIAVATQDEIGDLAREANRTAARLREYREHAEQHAAELARASRYKTEFLANMSHELRTPLNSIIVLSKLLSHNQDGVLQARHVELAGVIHRSGEELLALINEVLDLAKIEAGKQTVALSSVPVAELADYVRRMFAPLAADKQLAFAVDVAEALPVALRTDRARLGQILKNLIANALKFTERGRVAVRMARPDDTTRRFAGGVADPVVISVSDTGIGIPEDKRDAIFEAFTQAETGTSRKFAGTGLGLTIARQLAERLGGRLEVESEPGVGSTFHLVLPAAGPAEDGTEAAAGDAAAPAPRAAPAVIAAPAAPAPGADLAMLAGRTVLLVDDDMRNLYSLSSLLGDQRLRVLTATDGHEALDELDREPGVDVVLMDVMMPTMTGHEAMRRIRAQPRFARLPIIAVTARVGEGERERCLEAGADAFLAKPVDVAALLGLISSLLARDRAAGDPGS